MVIDEGVLVGGTEDVTARDVVADLELGRVEVPGNASVKSLGVDTTWSNVSPGSDGAVTTKVAGRDIRGM